MDIDIKEIQIGINDITDGWNSDTWRKFLNSTDFIQVREKYYSDRLGTDSEKKHKILEQDYKLKKLELLVAFSK